MSATARVAGGPAALADGTPDVYVDKERFNGSLDWTQRGPIVLYSASC